tara:strand:- start:74 stop:484 length:411 start_codon:yes stop_codon:yes gene_type:complete
MFTENIMRTPGQELCDTLVSVQLRVKVLEELLNSARNGMRSEEDFDRRFASNAWVLTDELKKIKPLVDKVFDEGKSAFKPKPVSSFSPFMIPIGSIPANNTINFNPIDTSKVNEAISTFKATTNSYADLSPIRFTA